MKEFHIYKDIRQRTNGEIYLGVVGPVRTGKSTFIRRFMDEMVIPHMEDGPAKTRSKDELPQAASGKNIMTTEPKFIPTEAAKIFLEDKTEMLSDSWRVWCHRRRKRASCTYTMV